ncbi:nuclear transport factor 2 family protein [Actinospongicola halichondriae]|uniref:nuclear transport factor 2 family protein n=1 Tax=Actinospongicola halichondriae TaxID=3236844 RepID=UPI003D533F12
MADADAIRNTIHTYCERYTDDRDGWLDLFAEGATVEDPVGSEPNVGKEAIGAFWDMTHAMADNVTLTPSSYVKVAGNEAAFAMDARMESADGVNGMSIIDVMTFDDDGKITSQRAYWDFADITAV